MFSQTLKKLGENGSDQRVFLKLLENEIYFNLFIST